VDFEQAQVEIDLLEDELVRVCLYHEADTFDEGFYGGEKDGIRACRYLD